MIKFKDGDYFVLRGSSWSNSSWYIRSTTAGGTSTDYHDIDYGFRLVRRVNE